MATVQISELFINYLLITWQIFIMSIMKHACRTMLLENIVANWKNVLDIMLNYENIKCGIYIYCNIKMLQKIG